MTVIIFDWDGTIGDNWPLYKRAATEYCQAYGKYCPTDAELQHAFGNTQWEGLAAWGPTWDDQHAVRNATYAQFYVLLANPENRILVPHVEDCLNRCRDSGMTLAIATSRPRIPLMEDLEHHHLTHMFTELLTGDCVKELGLEHKPAPHMIEVLAERLNAPRESIVMVGDTYMDIAMAQNASVKSIGVAWGMTPMEKLYSYQPTAVCEDPALLWAAIAEVAIEGQQALTPRG
jgi:phosphoglycolate phosphatase